MHSTFDSERLMKFARVVAVGGQPQICYHEKEVRAGLLTLVVVVRR